MINKLKVIDDIKNDGKYDAILDVVKKTLKSDDPTIEQIAELLERDPYYITEYKDLNRWGEISSVHIKALETKEGDRPEAKEIKEKINKHVEYLIHGEEYEVQSKDAIYMAWTGFIALPSIYVIDNIVRLFTNLYITNENHVYFSFLIVLVLSVWGFLKVKKNHKNQHERYVQKQVDTRALLKAGLENGYFTFEEVYRS